MHLNPKWQEGLWFLEAFLYQTADYKGAQDAFRSFTAVAPQAGPAWGWLALAEFQTGTYPQALEHIERSLERGTGEQDRIGSVLRYHHAKLLTRSGAFEKALRVYRSFLAATGTTDPALLSAIGLAALHRPQLAIEVPQAEQPFVRAAGTAAAFTMAGRQNEANSAFADLLKQYGNLPNAHYLYGCFLFPTQPDQAIAEMKRELAISPNHPGASAMIAWALLVECRSSSRPPVCRPSGGRRAEVCNCTIRVWASPARDGQKSARSSLSGGSRRARSGELRESSGVGDPVREGRPLRRCQA